jgi:hypothetical protein
VQQPPGETAAEPDRVCVVAVCLCLCSVFPLKHHAVQSMVVSVCREADSVVDHEVPFALLDEPLEQRRRACVNHVTREVAVEKPLEVDNGTVALLTADLRRCTDRLRVRARERDGRHQMQRGARAGAKELRVRVVVAHPVARRRLAPLVSPLLPALAHPLGDWRRRVRHSCRGVAAVWQAAR